MSQNRQPSMADLIAFANRDRRVPPVQQRRVTASWMKPLKSKPLQKIQNDKVREPMMNPMDKLTSLVQGYNDYISGFDLPDQRINMENYFNKNDPAYIDQSQMEENLAQSIAEENKYVQNRLWKLQKDDRYIPDYEDMDAMDDIEYETYMNNVINASYDSKPKRIINGSN